MKPLPTKAQEIQAYTDWINSLQDGTYLHAMFAKTGPRVANEIHNDFAIGPVAEIEEARRLLREEVDLLKREKETLAAEVAALTKQKTKLTDEVNRTVVKLRSLADNLTFAANSYA